MNLNPDVNSAFNRLLIEIIVYPSQSTATTIPIPEQQQLRNAKIFRMQTFTSDDIAKSPLGNDVVSPANLGQSYLNLYKTDASPSIPQTGFNGRGPGLYMQNVPMVLLHNTVTGSDSYQFWPYSVGGDMITWDNQSFIKLGTGLGNSGNVSYLLQVDYWFTTLANG